MRTEARSTCFQGNFSVSGIPDLKGIHIHATLSNEVENIPHTELL